MKNIYLLAIFSLLINVGFGQQKMILHNSGNALYAKEISAIDSIQFDNNYARFKLKGEANTLKIQKKFIDSLTFTTNNVSLNKIYIIYNGTETASIINPYATQGVNITATAGTVNVSATSGIENLEYHILGATANGSLTIATDKSIQLILTNTTLTNPAGAAISVSGGKTTNVLLTAGTNNTLSDGSTSSKNGTITTDGPIVISNSGNLSLTGVKKHGINTSSSVSIQNGTTTIVSAATDGIHSEGFAISGGTVNINSVGDGIDAGDGVIVISAGTINVTSTTKDVKAITTGKNTVTVSGGSINLVVSGAQSKGISAKGNLVFTGGSVTANLSGAAVLTASGSGFNASYSTAIKSDSLILVSGGNFNISIAATADGGKGFSAGKGISITDGTFTINNAGAGAIYTKSTGVLDSYSSSCFTTDADLKITGGTFNLTISGTIGKGLSADGNMIIGSTTGSPTIKITNTGTQLLVSGTSGSETANYTAPKCIKSEGILTINNGRFTLAVSNQNSTCIESDSTLFVLGGTIDCTVGGDQSKGIESAGEMTLSGGTITINATGGVVLETSGSGTSPSYCAGIKSDAQVNLSGANVTISGSGAGFKGVSADKNINMSAGNVSVTSTGAGTTYTTSTGTKDAYTSAAFSADLEIIITGGTLTTNCSGAGGKGLKSDKGITIGSTTGNPTLNIKTTGARFLVSGSDYAHPKTIVSSGPVVINNGKNTINSTDDGIHSDVSITINGGNTTVNAISTTRGVGEGVEAPNITFNGGVSNITASNDGINATYGTVSGGTESNDGSNVFIKGGVVIVAGSDAIDSNGNITITGGTTIVCGPTSSPEEGLDFNGTFNMNGGFLICAGSNSNMTKAMSASSTQRSMYLKSGAQLAANSVLHIEDSAGKELVTFKPLNAVYYFHFSSPNIAANTGYKVYFGGTYTGGSFMGESLGWGLYTGGTYSTAGATLKTSFTSSSSSTVNTLTF